MSPASIQAKATRFTRSPSEQKRPAHANLILTRESHVQTLRFLQGDWDCYAEMPEGLQGPVATSRIREQPGGWFNTVTTVRGGHRDGTFCSRMTFDAHKQKYVEASFLDNGDYGRSESDGWRGDTLVLEGRRSSQIGDDVDYKKAYTRLDGDTFRVVAHTRAGNADYRLENQGICKRSPGQPPDATWSDEPVGTNIASAMPPKATVRHSR